MDWTRVGVAGVHLLALGIGFGAVVGRGRAFARGDVHAALSHDNWWGLAALLWVGTGLWRAFGGLEKGADYYLASDAFWLKMTLVAITWALEALPMVTLIGWRVAIGRGQAPDVSRMRTLYALNAAEIVVLVPLPFIAAAMARGA